ncbi:hypothetical protein BJX68DRAFT_264013 [Aspergillus pseudodeflectus]|uniref:Uncharacterized protein n=1 Tax=Aspergillus pseudodeflectus TaxID=176178 RepID=A0ABR4KWL0_9EURO
MAGFASYHLQDLTFTGPQDAKRKPYASLAILDPIISIERRYGEYHIAARFNIETAILNYASQTKFVLPLTPRRPRPLLPRHLPHVQKQTLHMKPESDSSTALIVSRGFTSSTSATAGVTASQTPLGNVSLGLTRSRSLTVEYAMTSWSLAAHRVVSDEWPDTGEQVRYQWFWAGTQDESGRLSSDLKHAVKGHVVVKRIVPVGMTAPLPSEAIDEAEITDDIAEGQSKQNDEEKEEEEGEEVGEEGTDRQEKDDNGSDTTESENHTPTAVDNADAGAKARQKAKVVYTWESLLDFSFCVLARLTSNQVRGKYLRPVYIEDFFFRIPPLEDMIPMEDTVDISDILSRIKKDFENKLDELPEKVFFEIASAHTRRETVRTTQEYTTQDRKVKQEWAERKFDIEACVYWALYETAVIG